jgi:hypothetical protein
MMRRVLIAGLTLIALSAGRAEAVTVRDIIELAKAGLGEPVLLALIEVDRSVFAIDTASLKRLKEAGVSDAVIVAMIKSGRQPEPPPVAVPETAPQPAPQPEPQVVVIDHRDAAPAPAPYPVAVPVYVTAPGYGTSTRNSRSHTVETTIPTDQGLVRARVPVPPNCVKAEPVYWGFDGKLRPGSWAPQPTVVCR